MKLQGLGEVFIDATVCCASVKKGFPWLLRRRLRMGRLNWLNLRRVRMEKIRIEADFYEKGWTFADERITSSDELWRVRAGNNCECRKAAVRDRHSTSDQATE